MAAPLALIAPPGSREELADRQRGVRARLAELAAQRGDSWADLSRLVGRNAAWFQQYQVRRTPRVLPEYERRLLAMHFGVSERELGARDPWEPPV